MQRLFNVAINGATVLTNFDVKAAAGGANTAVDRTFAVTAGAGNNNLQIQFIHVSGQPDDPKVDAIEIAGAGNWRGGNNGVAHAMRPVRSGCSFRSTDCDGLQAEK